MKHMKVFATQFASGGETCFAVDVLSPAPSDTQRPWDQQTSGAYMSQKHPDFSILAARIAVSNLHKNTSESFFETCKVCLTGIHIQWIKDDQSGYV